MAIEVTEARTSTASQIAKSYTDNVDANFNIKDVLIYNEGTSDFNTLEYLQTNDPTGLSLISDGEQKVIDAVIGDNGNPRILISISKAFGSEVTFNRVYFTNQNNDETLAFKIAPKTTFDVVVELEKEINVTTQIIQGV